MHVGDIVAAPLPTNGSWYRARVLGTLENGNLDLYFVDFGDNGDCPLRDLRALRSVQARLEGQLWTRPWLWGGGELLPGLTGVGVSSPAG